MTASSPSPILLSVSGLKCDGCVNAVKRLILKQDAQAQVEVDRPAGTAHILSDQPAALFAERLTQAGYPSQPQ